MIKPSDAAIAELPRLIAPPPKGFRSWLERGPRASPSSARPAELHVVRSALRALVDLGDWRVAPYLTWLLAFEETRRFASRAIAELIPQDAEELGALDPAVRERSYGAPSWWSLGTPFPWPHRLELADAVAALRSTTDDVRIAGFLSFNLDGHVREAALRMLATSHDGRELRFMILRINDWVEPVARLAMRSCSARLRAGYEAPAVAALPLVVRLSGQKRWDHAAFVDLVERLLADTGAGQQALVEGLGQRSVASRRIAARIIRQRFASPLPPALEEALWRGLADPDVVVRSSLGEALARLCSKAGLARLIRVLSADPSARLRRRAFEWAEREDPEQSLALAADLVFDPNAWIREFSRQHLKSRGAVDVAELYRGALGPGRRQVGAILGLMETGEAADAQRLIPLIDGGSARASAAALRAAIALDPAQAEDLLLYGLSSPRPGLSRTASAQLRTYRGALPLGVLVELLCAPELHVRRNALKVLAARDVWAGLIGALRLRGADGDDFARAAVARWAHPPAGLYHRPDAVQLAELGPLVEGLQDFPEVRASLRSLLGVS